MRRTARALYATALAGAALGVTASAAAADPAAEVSPGSVEPGGSITITVTCDGVGDAPPEAIDASSRGFREGKVQLHRVEGEAGRPAGAAAYRGTALIASGGAEGAGGPAASAPDEGSGADPGTASGPGTGSGQGSDPADPGTAYDHPGTTYEHPGTGYDPGTGHDPGYEEPGVLGRAVSVVTGTTDAENGDAPPAGRDSTGSDTLAPDVVAPPAVATDTEAPGAGYDDPVTPDDVGPDALGPDTVPEPAAPEGVPDSVPDAVPDPVGPDTVPAAPVAPEAGGDRGQWGVDGVCPAPKGGHGKQWTASYSVARGAPAAHDPGDSAGTNTGAGERPPGVQQGVHAGGGGAFTDSVPALVAGGLLVAGAVCATVHRLRNRRT
ncbi:hypothetical protein AB0912_26770 [Streptomyces sp. NPDC007084]|uniref:hypothetical protein n=1 Tax=Streptomyces sp. NPDC007084 TaxID=3154313 RepID=UPI0034532143